MPSKVTTVFVENEADTHEFARQMASRLKAPYLILLTGDVGAGKTSWTRALIRALSGNDDLDVISPTFPLLQIYETKQGTVYHYDLYRLPETPEDNLDDIRELSWDDARANGICLVEWPERLPSSLAKADQIIHFHIDTENPNKRRIDITHDT